LEAFNTFEEFRGKSCGRFYFNCNQFSLFAYYQVDLVAVCIPVKIEPRTSSAIQAGLQNFQNNKIFLETSSQRIACELAWCFDAQQMGSQSSIAEVDLR
jgi:hypothetical protein